MAKYSKRASEKVEEVMHGKKEGKLKTGSGKKVTSRKQAIAIGLSEAERKEQRCQKSHPQNLYQNLQRVPAKSRGLRRDLKNKNNRCLSFKFPDYPPN